MVHTALDEAIARYVKEYVPKTAACSEYGFELKFEAGKLDIMPKMARTATVEKAQWVRATLEITGVEAKYNAKTRNFEIRVSGIWHWRNL